MIINETVLLEKFDEDDNKLYDYLIDSAITEEQIETFMKLQSMNNELTEDRGHYKLLRNAIVLDLTGVNLGVN